MKQKFIDCMMKFSHDAWGGDSIPSTEKSFAEVFDVLVVKAGFIQEWQPIETAPTDGTTILLYSDECTYSAWYNGRYWTVTGTPDNSYETATVDNPTHWQPLPPPPKL